MNISTLIQLSQKPSLYDHGTSVMWTDPYISKQLLNCHIDPNNDTASRSEKKIDLIVRWILSHIAKENICVLDLGCGPGLYAEKFAERGHTVTGIDFSENSIRYAKSSTRKIGSNIKYHCMNYLDMKYDDQFDLVILIYLDFCVLKPLERATVLRNINKSLKKGGLFIFDVVNAKNIDEKVIKQSWEVVPRGFWKDEPYLVLNKGYHYPENNVLLNQHVVVDGNGNINTYLFWSTYYEYEDIKPIMTAANFSRITKHENVLPPGDSWNGDNVTFYIAEK
jgi:SAM-dependent methyltransferase